MSIVSTSVRFLAERNPAFAINDISIILYLAMLYKHLPRDA